MLLAERLLVLAAGPPLRTLQNSTLEKATHLDKVRDSITTVRKIRVPAPPKTRAERENDFVYRYFAEHMDLPSGKLPQRIELYELKWRGAPPPSKGFKALGIGMGDATFGEQVHHPGYPIMRGPFGATNYKGTSGSLCLARVWVNGKHEDFVTLGQEQDWGEPGWIMDVPGQGFLRWPPEEKFFSPKAKKLRMDKGVYGPFYQAVSANPWVVSAAVHGNPPELVMTYDVPVVIPHKTLRSFARRNVLDPKRITMWVTRHLSDAAPALWHWIEQAQETLKEALGGHANVGLTFIPKSQNSNIEMERGHVGEKEAENVPLLLKLQIVLRASLQPLMPNPGGTLRRSQEEDFRDSLMHNVAPVLRDLHKGLTEAVLEQADDFNVMHSALVEERHRRMYDDYLRHHPDATSEELYDAIADRDNRNPNDDADEDEFEPQPLSSETIKTIVRFAHSLTEALHDRLHTFLVRVTLEDMSPEPGDYPVLKFLLQERESNPKGYDKDSMVDVRDYQDALEEPLKAFLYEFLPTDKKDPNYYPYSIEQAPLRDLKFPMGWPPKMLLKLNTRSDHALTRWADKWLSPKKLNAWVNVFRKAEDSLYDSEQEE